MRRAVIGAAVLLTSVAAQAVPEGPDYPSAEWTERELANYARTLEAPAEQAANPAFLLRWQTQGLANLAEWNQRALDDPSWLLLPALDTPLTPLCATWGEQCTGDPFRYPGVDGPDGAPFYDSEAEVVPVVFYDRACARLSGRVWAPRDTRNGLPAVIIENGSIQAPETLYWWAAQALLRAGYVVMTFDPRGQGRSDQQTPGGDQGSNLNSTVFWDGLVDAIDFFRSDGVRPYPHNLACAGTYPTDVTAFNPHAGRIDPARLGLAGHSLGATGVSVVQSYGAEGAQPWPGLLDADNPVDVIVAWDSLSSPRPADGERPAVVPRVPAMGHTSEYGIGGLAFTSPPDPESHKNAFAAWRDAGVPVFQLTIQGSTHFEWSLIPSFPSTSWCADTAGNRCSGGWGQPLAEHYTVAWFDRWLKQPGEPGYEDADARLLADADWVERFSFYSRSARDFANRSGGRHSCEDIRAGCDDADVGASGGGAGSGGFVLAALALLRRRALR
ncbi:alpha/beta hydrolase family protein [Sinimarinibacterium flocculans]|uniref:alpha/beta hydrolase family protein n=1 Tax=Sinimarinibacterium flocculans TaxID=985250 RepID=UPI0035146E85